MTNQNEQTNEPELQDVTAEDIETVASEAPYDSEPIDVDGDGLEEKVEELKKELSASEEKYLRLYAEFENYKRRTKQEFDTERTYGAQRLMTDLIPALDNFERALQQESDEPAFQSLHKGVEMVQNSFIEALKSHGLEVIDAKDQMFDPNVHHAVMQEADADKASGIVLDELQKGYKLKERVLRPAMVKVNE